MTKDALGQLEYAKEVSAPSDVAPPADEMPALPEPAFTKAAFDYTAGNSGSTRRTGTAMVHGIELFTAGQMHAYARQYAAQQAGADAVDDDASGEWDAVECARILQGMIESIQSHGNYSVESTVAYLNSALICLPFSVRDAAIAAARAEGES